MTIATPPSPQRTGKVYLVGAGPGDPGLITLRGKYLLEHAEVVVYDYLASPKLLNYVPKNAQFIYAGKKGGGLHAFTQDGINKLLVEHAKLGRMVVRLKGGDPFVFGRGGEEVEHLREAGIEVQVINGITSGLAGITSLGAPLTHRDHAHGVLFMTGHAKPGDSGPDWRQIAATAHTAKLTLVIYMGVSGAGHIQDELLTGLPASTPVAVIQNASLATQRHIATTLGALAEQIKTSGIASPSVIVVGDVVSGLAQAAAHPGLRLSA